MYIEKGDTRLFLFGVALTAAIWLALQLHNMLIGIGNWMVIK